MQCKHKTLFFLSGTLWLGIGVMLLTFGLRFLMEILITYGSQKPILLKILIKLFNVTQENGIVILITMALMLGFFKGKFILAKSAKREMQRISDLPNPISIKYIYSKKYYFLILSMVFLGFLIRFLPLDIRGFIDITIGSALINGARVFYRAFFQSFAIRA